MCYRCVIVVLCRCTFCGITMRKYVEANISPKSKTTIKHLMKIAATMCEIIIFMYLGISAVSDTHHWDTAFCILTLIFCLIFRALGKIFYTSIFAIEFPRCRHENWCNLLAISSPYHFANVRIVGHSEETMWNLLEQFGSYRRRVLIIIHGVRKKSGPSGMHPPKPWHNPSSASLPLLNLSCHLRLKRTEVQPKWLMILLKIWKKTYLISCTQEIVRDARRNYKCIFGEKRQIILN